MTTTASDGGWVKQGVLFTPARQRPWIVSHAAMPIADPLGGDRVRVYFSSRDERNRGQIGHFELDLGAPETILAITDTPSLSWGPLGAFDDNGVTGACLVHDRGRTYLYYSGWTLGVTVPFYLYVGLAVSEDGGRSFARVSPAPILERNAVDPYLTASPWVVREGDRWRMWYVSGTAWSLEDGRPKHRYHIKYAESPDGVRWHRTGHVCVDYLSEAEYAFSRPTVLRDGARYRMWYASRGEAYALGYAESADGLHWERRDREAGLARSVAGWDAEMIAYPCVFRHRETLFMLYNGNGYGRSGIGWAVRRRDG